MKKIFTMMVAAAFVFGTVGCDDKPKTSPPKTENKDKGGDKPKEGDKGGDKPKEGDKPKAM